MKTIAASFPEILMILKNLPESLESKHQLHARTLTICLKRCSQVSSTIDLGVNSQAHVY